LSYSFEVVDSALKNHCINSSKTSINKDKNTYKKRVCNQQESISYKAVLEKVPNWTSKGR